MTDPLDTELPPEVMAPPVMGTERETGEVVQPGEDEIPPQMRAPKPELVDESRAPVAPTGETIQPTACGCQREG